MSVELTQEQWTVVIEALVIAQAWYIPQKKFSNVLNLVQVQLGKVA